MASAHKALLTPLEAAEFLCISQETLAQWRSQRRGPDFVKLRAGWFVTG
jgi:hypothetical protein